MTAASPEYAYTLLDGVANGYQYDAERLSEEARKIADEPTCSYDVSAIVRAIQGNTAATLALAHTIDRWQRNTEARS